MAWLPTMAWIPLATQPLVIYHSTQFLGILQILTLNIASLHTAISLLGVEIIDPVLEIERDDITSRMVGSGPCQPLCSTFQTVMSIEHFPEGQFISEKDLIVPLYIHYKVLTVNECSVLSLWASSKELNRQLPLVLPTDLSVCLGRAWHLLGSITVSWSWSVCLVSFWWADPQVWVMD